MKEHEKLMSRRGFIKASLAGSALIGMSGISVDAGRSRSRRPPNFVVIFTDDQGYQDIGCFGAEKIKTPRLDRMAAEGMKFTDFYVAAPACGPSRAALMTGRYPQRVGMVRNVFPAHTTGLDPNEITIADLLKTRGYATACIGKWHLGHMPQFMPNQQGFDYYYGIPYSNDMDAESRNEPPIPLMRNGKVIEQPVDQDTITDRYTEEAIKFITNNKDRPFFLYLPHAMPHVPLHVPDRFRGKSEGGLYGDVIEHLDWSTGEILDALEELGLSENTIVIYTSDNGPWLAKGEDGGSALPLRAGKGSTYEGGMRVPCIMWWPGTIPAGTVSSEMATTMDLLPTFARLAGAELPKDRIIDGKDISPLMKGVEGARTPHHVFYYYRHYMLQALRSGRWKLILERTEGSAQRHTPLALYDLERDISEENDLSADYPRVVERLFALAEECREDLGDSLTGRVGKNIGL